MPHSPYCLTLIAVALSAAFTPQSSAQAPHSVSGIYPSLAYFNNEGECGTGAVVPWADRLWVITYAPHMPKGSSDKLYEITPDLLATVRPESVGGTPANRLIHRESQQLFIGPYAIDAQRAVRVMPPTQMFGRHTGTARHLTDPANKVYYATMEEGIYEVDVHTLAPTTLWADEQVKEGRHADLPGYHGKGFYMGQGRVIYANNGDHAKEALSDPTVPSGILAEWDGKADAWSIVRRNQFTEVTGPGGIYGSEHPDTDPVWSIGWDDKSLILQVLDHGQWHTYRLPKTSHCYDGAHGWNTEWPRIREIGDGPMLMTMHGMFWSFPKTFDATHSAGITPRSSYLKVVGDFCRWQDRIVLGCDDTAKSEFLNKSKAKGNIAGPGQSQSNLWFLDPAQLDSFGPQIGRGAVWLNESVKAGAISDAMLFSGFARRGVQLAHGNAEAVGFTFEVDRKGDGQWASLRTVSVPAKGALWVSFAPDETAAWVRVKTSADCDHATVFFGYNAEDKRGKDSAAIFAGLATTTSAKDVSCGLIRARGENKRTLSFAASQAADGKVKHTGYYELDAELKLKRVDDAKAEAYVAAKTAIPTNVLTTDAASVLYIDDKGKRWRLPKGDDAYDHAGPLGPERIDREVCTERDLFNAHGTLYELPANNAGGMAKARPIASHNLRLKDYCSYRGLLVLSGVNDDAKGEHIIRSDDGKAALWVGAVDDLWQLGKPRGHGGPWSATPVKAGVPSDPYLMTGYDKKCLHAQQTGAESTTITIEVDISGTGLWKTWQSFDVADGKGADVAFPEGFAAYWVRALADKDCTATVTLSYE